MLIGNWNNIYSALDRYSGLLTFQCTRKLLFHDFNADLRTNTLLLSLEMGVAGKFENFLIKFFMETLNFHFDRFSCEAKKMSCCIIWEMNKFIYYYSFEGILRSGRMEPPSWRGHLFLKRHGFQVDKTL